MTFVALFTWIIVGTPLSDAQSAYEGLEYERCATEAESALMEPATLPGRVDAYRLLGLCRAALGNADLARDAFVSMLAIDPKARLPDGLSPRFTSSFLEAKGFFVDAEPLELAISSAREEDGARVVVLEVQDALEMITQVAVRDAAGLRPGLRVARRMELTLPLYDDAEIVALDASDGEVAVLAVPGMASPTAGGTGEPTPRVVATEQPSQTVAEDGDGVWLWVGVGAATSVVLAGAALLGVSYAQGTQAVNLRSAVVFGDER